MQELINIEERDGQLVTTSRNVAEVFRKQHKHVLKNIQKCIKECESVGEFSEPNFGLAEYIDEQGKPRPEYAMTQKGWTLLVMSFSGSKASKFKIKYIEAFDAMREELSTYPQVTAPQNYKEALLALIANEEEKELLLIENSEMKPKADAYDTILDAGNCKDMAQVSKIFGLGRGKLFKILREEKYLMDYPTGHPRRNEPYSEYMNVYFEVVLVNKSVGDWKQNFNKTVITPKGLDMVRELLEKQKGA